MSTDYTLAYGTQATPADGRCAMEWVSYLAREPHTDAPVCVSPVVRAFCIALNDDLDDRPRQRLRLYLSRTMGSADDGFDQDRGWLAMDWLVRTYTSAWLAVACLRSPATALQRLPPISGSSELRIALPVLTEARRAARDASGPTRSSTCTRARAHAKLRGRLGRPPPGVLRASVSATSTATALGRPRAPPQAMRPRP